MSAHANGAKPRRNAQRMFTSRFEIFRAVPRVAPVPGLYQAELAPRTGLLVWSIDTELRGRLRPTHPIFRERRAMLRQQLHGLLVDGGVRPARRGVVMDSGQAGARRRQRRGGVARTSGTGSTSWRRRWSSRGQLPVNYRKRRAIRASALLYVSDCTRAALSGVGRSRYSSHGEAANAGTAIPTMAPSTATAPKTVMSLTSV